jgi:hypothetical protein
VDQAKKGSVDVVAELAPFLGTKPSVKDQGMLPAESQQRVDEAEAVTLAAPGELNEIFEVEGDPNEIFEVQEFIQRYSGRGGVPYLASAVLESLARNPTRPLPASVRDALLKMEVPLRGMQQ